MKEYYTDSARKSLWVSTNSFHTDYFGNNIVRQILTCFAAKNNSGFRIGQQIHDPKLQNSNWQPLDGEILVEEVLV